MKHAWKFAAALMLAASLWWALAQQAPRPLEALMPAGALVYVEARDFGALLSNWDASAEKTAWLQSAAYSVFSRSHLLLRLADAQNGFANAAGVPPDYALLTSVAGANSAIAIYDINKLDFLYITRLPSARALNTALWRARGTYQTRRAANVDYYVKTDPDSQRTAAFATSGDLLLLATRESALAGALELLAGQNNPSLAAEPWFTAAIAAAEPGARDLRAVYDLQRLPASYAFRSHWIQGNATALREFSSGLADLERTPAEIRERRVMLRTVPTTDRAAAESAAGQLQALVPDAAGLYRVWTQPSTADVETLLAGKFFAAADPRRADARLAPQVFDSGSAGDEGDLETRIDQPPPDTEAAAGALASLRPLLESAPLEAMLDVSATRVDAQQVFVRPESAVVLLAAAPWNEAAVSAALSQAVAATFSHSGIAPAWTKAAGNPLAPAQLSNLDRLTYVIDGPRLILGDSLDLVNAVAARRTQAAAAGSVYAAGWRHARELPNFERMMRLIDFPEIRTETPNREPAFFSESLGSLGRVLGRVDSVNLTEHDSGALVRTLVQYRIAP